MTACPCSPAKRYVDCCGPMHAGTAVAATAEALMRSRYSAYVRADAVYLLATWHPDTRPAALDFGDAGLTRWLGLEVRRHEVSRFRREEGRWYYVDGEFPAH